MDMNAYAGASAPYAPLIQHPTGEWLSAYTDSELGEAARAAVERHLRACAPCAATVRRYREVGWILRGTPPRTPPPACARPWERRGTADPTADTHRPFEDDRRSTSGGTSSAQRGRSAHRAHR